MSISGGEGFKLLITLLGVLISIVSVVEDCSPSKSSDPMWSAEREKKATQIKQVEQLFIGKSWIGITKPEGKNYLTEVSFLKSRKGKRTIYLSAEGIEGCKVEQLFIWDLVPGSSKDRGTIFIISRPTKIDYPQCDEMMLAEAQKVAYKTPRSMGISFQKDKKQEVLINSYKQKESLLQFKADAPQQALQQNYKALKQLLTVEKELILKFKSHQNQQFRNTFSITEKTNDLTIIRNETTDTLGHIEMQSEEIFFLTTTFWEKSGENYSHLGTWKNIPYIDEKGKEKIGNLRLCFRASEEQKFTFLEVDSESDLFE